MCRVNSALIGALISLLGSQVAVAAPINGILQLPPKFKGDSRPSTRGFCERQSNEVLNVLPPLIDPRRQMVVALLGSNLSGKKPAEALLVMEDARFNPPVVAVPPGMAVTFRNKDSSVHILEPATAAKKGETKFMSPLRVASGSDGRHSFTSEGEFQLRCSELPHMRATVLVRKGALFSVPDATGSFRFKDVPPGSYSLRIWYQGKWVIKQSLTVKKAKGRLTIKVQLPRNLGRN